MFGYQKMVIAIHPTHNLCMSVILMYYLCFVALKQKLPYTEYEKQTVRQGTDPKVVSSLHGVRTIKLGFVDDSSLLNKSQSYQSRKLSVFICPFQHVKHIKSSEVEKEFHYISGHVVEFLSHCHPKLLIKWCENLMIGETLASYLRGVKYITLNSFLHTVCIN